MARVLVTTDYLRPGRRGRHAAAQARPPGHLQAFVGTPASRRRHGTVRRHAGAIVASEPITADMLSHAATLKVIARSGVGYDSIDTAAARPEGSGSATPPASTTTPSPN